MTLQNIKFGKIANEIFIRGKISLYIYSMHLWYAVNKYSIGTSGDDDVRSRIIRFLANINDPTLSQTEIQYNYRVGGRLLQLKRMFGWSILLFKSISWYALRDMRSDVFESLMKRIEEETDTMIRLKEVVDRTISRDNTTEMMIQIVTDVSHNEIFAKNIINVIDRIMEIYLN